MYDPRQERGAAVDSLGLELPFEAEPLTKNGIGGGFDRFDYGEAPFRFAETMPEESLTWLDFEEEAGGSDGSCRCRSGAPCGRHEAPQDEWVGESDEAEALIGDDESYEALEAFDHYDSLGFASEAPAVVGTLWSYASAAAKAKVALFVPPAAERQSNADVLFYVHGLLSPCGVPKILPQGIVSSGLFKLADAVTSASRPTILVVPLFQQSGSAAWSAHGLEKAERFNAFMAEALAEVGKKFGGTAPRLDRLAIAGHSRAFGVLNPLASEAGRSAMASGALASLAQYWALDASYGSFPLDKYRALAGSKPALGVHIVYRTCSPTDKFTAATSGGGVKLWPIANHAKVRHCDVPKIYIPLLLREMATPGARSDEAGGVDREEPAFENEVPAHSFSHCPAGARTVLAASADRALKAVNNAAAFVGSAYGRPDRMHPQMRALLAKHFHTADHDDLRTILTNLIGIGKALKDGVRFECRTECAADPGGKLCGYAATSQWFGGFGAVNVCFDPRPGHCRFDREPERTRDRIIIHEVAHRYKGIDDHAYCWKAEYNRLTAGQALDNADSYACFALDMMTVPRAAAPVREAEAEGWLEQVDSGFETVWHEAGVGSDAEEEYLDETLLAELEAASEFERGDEEDEDEYGRFDAFGDMRDSEWEDESSESEQSFEETEFEDEAPGASPFLAMGLNPAEAKALEITATLETGGPFKFYGLTGNFDGQGLSFGLVNWTIGTGSLQPLLLAFAKEESAGWARIFGSDADVFLKAVQADKKVGHKFAVETMNDRKVVKTSKGHKTVWSIKEPWKSYFKALSEDEAFRRIQVRFVRPMLKKADEYCRKFGFKSEMAFAFMFDAVSSHGQWWLTKKFVVGGKKVPTRQLLIDQRLSFLKTMLPAWSLTERDQLNIIADVLAATSSPKWAENVRVRKHWFTGGPAPRDKALLDVRIPSPDRPYATASEAMGETGEFGVTGEFEDYQTEPLDEAEFLEEHEARRKDGIGAAIEQAQSAGSETDRAALARALHANGTSVAEWFGGMVPDATFLGVRIRASGGSAAGVHREFLTVLRKAEAALLAKYPGKTAKQLGQDMGITHIAGLRPPKKATGGGQISMHCYGMAVDINHDTNPFIGNQKAKRAKGEKISKFEYNRSPYIIDRAMQLIHGRALGVAGPKPLVEGSGPVAVARAWDIHHEASQALARYLSLADNLEGGELGQLVLQARAAGYNHPLEWWQKWIKTDRSVIKYWDFPNHSAPWRKGYMDLPRDLVIALAEVGMLWGGVYNGAKDIMHFDYRRGTIKARA